MEQKINIVSKDSIANELNIANLTELLNTLGIDAKAQKQAGQITLQVAYTGEQISNLKKRNAGRKRKLTENLTYGDVEQLLETTSVNEIARLANISRATCYRRIQRLRQYQEESKKENVPFGEIYKGYTF
ncbi:MAG: AsnC family protein [Roseburia sp.]|nr:AsnC family protein [Roseburia sp.]